MVRWDICEVEWELPNAKSGNYDFRLLCKIFCENPNIKRTDKDVS